MTRLRFKITHKGHVDPETMNYFHALVPLTV